MRITPAAFVMHICTLSTFSNKYIKYTFVFTLVNAHETDMYTQKNKCIGIK